MSDEVSRRAREDDLAAELIAKKAARDEADLIKAREWAAILRAEADSCLASSQGNGECNASFYVAHIVLSSLATRLETLAGLKAGRAEREEG